VRERVGGSGLLVWVWQEWVWRGWVWQEWAVQELDLLAWAWRGWAVRDLVKQASEHSIECPLLFLERQGMSLRPSSTGRMLLNSRC
jgi:hypothetical protein